MFNFQVTMLGDIVAKVKRGDRYYWATLSKRLVGWSLIVDDTIASPPILDRIIPETSYQRVEGIAVEYLLMSAFQPGDN